MAVNEGGDGGDGGVVVRTINSYNVEHRLMRFYETNFVFNYINFDFI